QSLLFGSEHLFLELLQLLGDEALASRGRLAPHVIRGDPRQIGRGDLDEVPEDLVVADLERLDPRALALARFQRRDGGPAVPSTLRQAVETGVVTRTEDPAVLELERWVVGERAGQERGQWL